MLSKRFALLVLVALTTGVFAQVGSTNASKTLNTSPSPLASQTCLDTYTSGSGAKYMSFCVTVNGNIIGFTAPSGFGQEYPVEGYGICDLTSTPHVSYYDFAGLESGNWLNPTRSQPNGANTFPLTITRLTSDGIWQVKQAFSRNTTDRYVKITVSLTNKSGITRPAWLMRYIDVDADGTYTGDVFVSGTFSSSSIESNGGGHGLTLAALPTTFGMGGWVADHGGYDPCGTAFGTLETPPYTGDGALMYYVYYSSTGQYIGPGATRTVTFEYRAM